MSDNYYQYAYVTTDWKQAMADIAATHQIGGWMEMPDTEFDTGQDKTATCHFALAYKNALQFEIIQPLGGDCDVYRSILPPGGYALKFHHLGRHMADRDAYEAQKTVCAARWSMPIAWETMGGTYSYFDARADTGHFLEYFCFPPGSHMEGVPRW